MRVKKPLIGTCIRRQVEIGSSATSQLGMEPKSLADGREWAALEGPPEANWNLVNPIRIAIRRCVGQRDQGLGLVFIRRLIFCVGLSTPILGVLLKRQWVRDKGFLNPSTEGVKADVPPSSVLSGMESDCVSRRVHHNVPRGIRNRFRPTCRRVKSISKQHLCLTAKRKPGGGLPQEAAARRTNAVVFVQAFRAGPGSGPDSSAAFARLRPAAFSSACFRAARMVVSLLPNRSTS